MYAHCQHLEDCPQFFAEPHSFQHDLGTWYQSDHVTGWWVWLPDHETCPPHLQDNTRTEQHSCMAHTHTHTHTHTLTNLGFISLEGSIISWSVSPYNLLTVVLPLLSPRDSPSAGTQRQPVTHVSAQHQTHRR